MDNPLIKSDKKNIPYYPGLDGLRGLAILIVVFFHNFNYIKYFGFGWLGVDLFFVLSGFLITNILIRTFGENRFLFNFFLRRALRIFPLYYLVLIVTLFLLPKVLSGDNLQYYHNNQLWFWAYFQNWLYVFYHPRNTNFLLHFWSLAIEEQFYLAWPLVILILRRVKKLLLFMFLLLLIISIGRIVIWHFQFAGLQYFSLYTFTRIDGICIGCILALQMIKNEEWIAKYMSVIVITLAGLNFLFFFLNQSDTFSFPFFAFVGYTTFAAMFAMLVYEIAMGKTKIINVIFNLSILKFFGKISYGFYVFHWPVYLILNPHISLVVRNKLKFDPYPSQIASSIICTLFGLGISVLSYYFLEKKILALKRHFT